MKGCYDFVGKNMLKTKSNKICCEVCGAKMVEYSHSLNIGLVLGLRKLILHGKPAKLKDLGLTLNQFNNFQKLQYWGFVEKNSNNEWTARESAYQFFRGFSFPKSVKTYRGEITKFSEEKTNVGELRIEYQKKLDYVREQTPISF